MIATVTLIFFTLVALAAIGDRIKDRRSLKSPKRPSDIPWGEGKDLSELVAVLSHPAPDLPALYANSIWAQLEVEWEKDHPDPEKEIASLKEQLAQARANADRERSKYNKAMYQIRDREYGITRFGDEDDFTRSLYDQIRIEKSRKHDKLMGYRA